MIISLVDDCQILMCLISFNFQTPLFLAVQAGNITMTTWLVKNGADPTIQGTVSILINV